MPKNAPMPKGGTYRPGLAAALAAAGALLTAWAAWQSTWADPVLPRPVLAFFMEAGYMVTAFVVIVGVFTAGWLVWSPRVDVLGRRGVSALFLLGTGAGLLALGPVTLVVDHLLARPDQGGFEAAVLSVPVMGAAWLVLARDVRRVRLILIPGTALAFLGGTFLPGRVPNMMMTALAVITLMMAVLPDDAADAVEAPGGEEAGE